MITNKNASLKFRLQVARMLDNAIQHYWKLVVERLYHIVPWLGGYMHFAERERDTHTHRERKRERERCSPKTLSWQTAISKCWNNTCIEQAREVGIAPGTILHILKKMLKMKKICARWVPHYVHLERYGCEGERFFRRIITLDKTWVQCYQPKLKR